MLFVIALFSFSTLLIADELQLNENAPKTYIVKKGDTLWDISAIFLDQPWLWPKLWRLNPEINNPHLIYPGDVLSLVYDEQGEPMLVVEKPKVKPSLKWSPKVREKIKNDAINTLPLEVIAPYIHYDNMFTQEQLDGFPYVIGSDEGYKMNIDRFNVYVNGDLELAKTYAIYQKSFEIIDPETEESLGYSVKLVGTGQATDLSNLADKKPATLFTNSTNREIRAGSYVVPINEGQLLPAYFTMQAADKSLRGSIIHSSSDGREFGKLEVVMINRGSEHKVKQGDVLSINRQSPSVVETNDGPMYGSDVSRWYRLGDADYNMPEENLGKMMVFKVYNKVSMALVLTTTKPARLQDIVAAP